MKLTPKGLWEVLKQTVSGFMSDKVTKLSASLAYYTTFSLGPMLIVIIYISEILWKEAADQGTIYKQISGLVGSKAALQIQDIIKNAAIDKNNSVAAVVGFITLILGATTIFAEIQDSINTIWKLKVKTERGWFILLKNRLLSFSLVISLGFLLLVSLTINSLVEALMDKLTLLFPQITVVLLYIVNLLVTFVITASLFATIFKVLPDAIIRFKDVIAGAVFTAILFMFGKFAITLYITSTDVGSAYGTAGSLVVLLLWVYYSSIILYFGAEFTKFYAVKYGCEIQPDKYAVIVQTVQVESNKRSVQENEEDTLQTQVALQKAKDNLDATSGSEI